MPKRGQIVFGTREGVGMEVKRKRSAKSNAIADGQMGKLLTGVKLGKEENGIQLSHGNTVS